MGYSRKSFKQNSSSKIEDVLSPEEIRFQMELNEKRKREEKEGKREKGEGSGLALGWSLLKDGPGWEYLYSGPRQDVIKGLSEKDKEDIISIVYIASMGNTDWLDFTFEKDNIDIDTIDTRGRTPLIYAAVNGRCDTVEYLLSKNADPFVVDYFHNIALHYMINLYYADGFETATLIKKKMRDVLERKGIALCKNKKEILMALKPRS